jgi:predicted PurR-regulated permease PerM
MQKEITRTLLAVIAISALIIATFWVLRPFLSAIIWASTLVIATWPVMIMLQAKFRGHRTPAIALMTIAMLLLLILPFWMAIGAIAEQIDQVGVWTRQLAQLQIPPPPVFLNDIPLIGEKAAKIWHDAATGGWGLLATKAQPYIVQIVRWLASEVGTVGALIVQFLLTVLVAAVLYAYGEGAAKAARQFGRRLAGARGENAILLAGQAVRGVALGVVVTALVQALLAGAGLYFVGVPLAGGLTVAILMLCIAQLGPLPVLLPAVGWIYLTGDNTMGTVLLIWTVIVSSLDNFLRPVLIRKGADLPLLLIFAGVIGGLISFGLLGIFVGPVVLAVSYKLFQAWINESGPE